MAGDFLRLARRCPHCGRWLVLRRTCRACKVMGEFNDEIARVVAAWRGDDAGPAPEEPCP